MQAQEKDIIERLHSLETSVQSFGHAAHKFSRCLEIMAVNIGATGFQLERARDAIAEGNDNIAKYLDTAQDWFNKTSGSMREILSSIEDLIKGINGGQEVE